MPDEPLTDLGSPQRTHVFVVGGRFAPAYLPAARAAIEGVQAGDRPPLVA